MFPDYILLYRYFVIVSNRFNLKSEVGISCKIFYMFNIFRSTLYTAINKYYDTIEHTGIDVYFITVALYDVIV